MALSRSQLQGRGLLLILILLGHEAQVVSAAFDAGARPDVDDRKWRGEMNGTDEVNLSVPSDAVRKLGGGARSLLSPDNAGWQFPSQTTLSFRSRNLAKDVITDAWTSATEVTLLAGVVYDKIEIKAAETGFNWGSQHDAAKIKLVTSKADRTKCHLTTFGVPSGLITQQNGLPTGFQGLVKELDGGGALRPAEMGFSMGPLALTNSGATLSKTTGDPSKDPPGRLSFMFGGEFKICYTPDGSFSNDDLTAYRNNVLPVTIKVLGVFSGCNTDGCIEDERWECGFGYKGENPSQCDSGSSGGSDSGPKLPGDAHYWTKLLGLGFSEGTLKPSFDPDTLKYSLFIKSGKSKELLVTPMIDTHKYELLYKPKLFWEEVDMDYSPIENIEFKLPLNASGPGPLSKTVTLSVKDPKDDGGFLFHGGPAHDYTIDITQAPDIEEIVTATAIKVVGQGADGTEYSTPNIYNPKSLKNEIRYVVSAKVKTVGVTVTCPGEATSLKYNGQTTPQGSVYQSGTFEGSTKSILGQSIYKNKKWTHNEEMQRTYVITIARNSTLEGTEVDLRMWPPSQQGNCHKLDVTNPKSKYFGWAPGWECMKGPPTAQFVGSFDNPHAYEEQIHKLEKEIDGHVRREKSLLRRVDVLEKDAEVTANFAEVAQPVEDLAAEDPYLDFTEESKDAESKEAVIAVATEAISVASEALNSLKRKGSPCSSPTPSRLRGFGANTGGGLFGANTGGGAFGANTGATASRSPFAQASPGATASRSPFAQASPGFGANTGGGLFGANTGGGAFGATASRSYFAQASPGVCVKKEVPVKLELGAARATCSWCLKEYVNKGARNQHENFCQARPGGFL